MIRSLIVAGLAMLPAGQVLAWGEEGHSIVAEIAARRLTPEAAAMVQRLLGPGSSLASISSWADDVRDARPATYNWHFVDIPVADDTYDPAVECKPNPARGDCVIAELGRLKNDLRCAADDEGKREALKFAAHFVGAPVLRPVTATPAHCRGRPAGCVCEGRGN